MIINNLQIYQIYKDARNKINRKVIIKPIVIKPITIQKLFK